MDRLTPTQADYRERARTVAAEVLRQNALRADAAPFFPRENWAMLREVGLMDLRNAACWGGPDADALTWVLVTEELGRECASTAMAHLQHTQYARMAQDHADPVVWAAVMDNGGPRARQFAVAFPGAVTAAAGGYALDPATTFPFVTPAGEADYYVLAVAHRDVPTPGYLTALLVDRAVAGWEVVRPWAGVAMRASASAPMRFRGTIPPERLLGAEGGAARIVFSVADRAAMWVCWGAVGLGLAQRAHDLVMAHLGPRRGTLGAIETVRQRVADLQIVLDRTRAFIYHAARLAADPEPVGRRLFLEARVAGQEAALEATELALRLLGATAIAGTVPAARLHLDAHALPVMYPNLDMDRLTVADEALAALAAPPGA